MSEPETRTELSLLRDDMNARFARMEELMQTGFARMDRHVEATHEGFARMDRHVEATHGGFARMDRHVEATHGGFARMEQHIEATHAGFARMDQHIEATHAAFARNDRYMELQQAQHLELRAALQNLRGEVQELTRRVDRVEERLIAMQSEVGATRDWAVREFADVRLEIRRLRLDLVERDEAVRGEVDTLDQRVARLERRLAE
jgi:chromosome segregation ATPase